ncbi:RNA recognition motif family protein, partial [Reticulomyxa filosa]
CGVLKKDIYSGKWKIKLYKNEAGVNKGDALVTYFKPEAVPLAVQLLDGTEIKTGYPVKVEAAQFKCHGEYVPTKRRRLNANERRVLREMHDMSHELTWDENGDNIAPHLHFVILKPMFTLEAVQAAEDSDAFYAQLKNEIFEECSKLALLIKLMCLKFNSLQQHMRFIFYFRYTYMYIFFDSPSGAVSVKFKHPKDAQECINRMNRRYFDTRIVECFYWDGITDYRYKETEEEQIKRLEHFQDNNNELISNESFSIRHFLQTGGNPFPSSLPFVDALNKNNIIKNCKQHTHPIGSKTFIKKYFCGLKKKKLLFNKNGNKIDLATLNRTIKAEKKKRSAQLMRDSESNLNSIKSDDETPPLLDNAGNIEGRNNERNLSNVRRVSNEDNEEEEEEEEANVNLNNNDNNNNDKDENMNRVSHNRQSSDNTSKTHTASTINYSSSIRTNDQMSSSEDARMRVNTTPIYNSSRSDTPMQMQSDSSEHPWYSGSSNSSTSSCKSSGVSNSISSSSSSGSSNGSEPQRQAMENNDAQRHIRTCTLLMEEAMLMNTSDPVAEPLSANPPPQVVSQTNTRAYVQSCRMHMFLNRDRAKTKKKKKKKKKKKRGGKKGRNECGDSLQIKFF